MVGSGGRQSPRSVSRGQAEVIGVVLVLAMTLIGATLALALGATALDNARVDSQEGSIEHAMTQLDSRSAMVALGDSEVQRVRMAATGSGVYSADPDAGRIVITHVDYDGSGDNEVIYNETLGAVVYQKDDKRIAYQGGGVWISQGSWSKMVSPPEFQYRGSTLTLPVIRVQNGGVAGGSSTVAEVQQQGQAKRIYPNLNTAYEGGTPNYLNPIREGNVTVAITSDYYQAWAEYFETRTEGEVTIDHANKTAKVKLLTIGITGRFVMPADGNSIQLRGLASGHLIDDFSLTLYDDDQDSADFSNLKWSLYVDDGSQNFEIHLRDEGGGQCGGDVGLTIYYTDNNGANYSSWTSKSAFQYECESKLDTDFNDDGDKNDKRLVVNLTSQTQLKYEPVKGGDGKLLFFSVSGSDTFDDSEEFVKHNGVDWEPKTFNEGNQTSVDNVTNHYLTLMGPRVELTVDDVAGNTVNEQASHGDFEQSGAEGKFITFLQITENRVSIELE